MKHDSIQDYNSIYKPLEYMGQDIQRYVYELRYKSGAKDGDLSALVVGKQLRTKVEGLYNKIMNMPTLLKNALPKFDPLIKDGCVSIK